MAYNKKTWKARQGLGLNKFSIDGATPVPVINQPDSVTQQGDALSAGNLNDLEQRIADAFDDVEESKADKSTTDALQSQINQHDARLQNLEQKAGDYSIVQYRGTNAVPTGKAKYGLVKSIVGKTRAWNQWVKNGNFADASEWSGTNFSISDGVCTITATGDNLYVYQNSDCYIQGHVYYCGFNIRNSAVIDRVRINTASRITGSASYYAENNIPSSTNWVKKGMILAVGEATYYDKIDIYVLATSGTVVEIKDLVLYDLTLIFGAGNEPSTVADALAQLPALGEYNAYDAGSLVDETLSGARSTSINIWDEEWEVGKLNGLTGVVDTSVTNAISSKNFIKVSPNTAYYLKLLTANMNLAWYDANYNFISGNNNASSNTTRTSPNNAMYAKLGSGVGYGNTYKNDIQICLDSYADKTIYHPHVLDTLSLSETVTLKSAGSVADELDVESGVIMRKISSVLDLSTLAWTYSASRWYASFTGIKWSNNNTQCNIISSHYESDTASRVYANAKLNTIACEDGNRISVYNGSTTTEPTGSIVYELATPTTESIDPVPDNTILTEGGGTIETIQSQTPVIDNCLDVGYLAL